MVKPIAMDISDWNKWHDEYEDPNSELAHRARLVQKQVVAKVDSRAPSPVSIVRVCGGQGRELFGALEDRPRLSYVSLSEASALTTCKAPIPAWYAHSRAWAALSGWSSTRRPVISPRRGR